MSEPNFCVNDAARANDVIGPPGGPAIDLTDLVEIARQDLTAEVWRIAYRCSVCDCCWIFNHEIDGETMTRVGDGHFAAYE